VFVILQTATKAAIIGSQAAIAVGAVLAITSLIGGTESSASMNPWRTLGPAIINNAPDMRHSLWIFIVGPLLGSILAFMAVTLVQGLARKTNEITSAYGGAQNDDIDKPKNEIP
jgi:aquaporin Z